VLFGGIGGQNDVEPFGDTWAWDGSAWTELQTGGPDARWGAGYGLQGGKLVLFGGCPGTSAYLDDTWTFDGHAWQPVGASGPGERVYAQAAPLAGSLILMGGAPSGATWGLDMWSFDGAAWNALGATVPGIPDSVGGYGFPFQAAVALGGRIILFGGLGPQNQVLGDTWSFDGSSWQKLAVTGPPGRYGAVLAPLGDRALLFGGSTDWLGENPVDDTWLFDGTSWTFVGAPGPSPRADAAAAERDGVVVLFGGLDGQGAPFGDTWEFDGTTWTQVNTKGPSPRGAAAMVTLP
jgi:hypothetical protein